MYVYLAEVYINHVFIAIREDLKPILGEFIDPYIILCTSRNFINPGISGSIGEYVNPETYMIGDIFILYLICGNISISYHKPIEISSILLLRHMRVPLFMKTTSYIRIYQS